MLTPNVPINHIKNTESSLGKIAKNLSKREVIAIYPKSEFEAFKHCLTEQIKQLVAICEKHNIRYRVDCGTLLGLYREKDLIFPDFDNDFGICMSDITEEFIMELSNLGLFRDMSTTMYWGKQELLDALHTDAYYPPKVLKIKDHTKTRRFFGSRIPITTDLFFWIDYEGNSYSNLYSTMEMVQKCSNIYPLQKYETIYGTVNIPINTESYLSDMYGDDWKIPNPEHRDMPGHVRGLKRRWITGEIKWNFVRNEAKSFAFPKPGKHTDTYTETK